MNYLLQFIFETGDTDPAHYNVFVVVTSETDLDYATIEDSVSSYLESVGDDLGFDELVEDIMNASGLAWRLPAGVIPESKSIHTIWI